jgi:hypothetical protein
MWRKRLSLSFHAVNYNDNNSSGREGHDGYHVFCTLSMWHYNVHYSVMFAIWFSSFVSCCLCLCNHVCRSHIYFLMYMCIIGYHVNINDVTWSNLNIAGSLSSLRDTYDTSSVCLFTWHGLPSCYIITFMPHLLLLSLSKRRHTCTSTVYPDARKMDPFNCVQYKGSSDAQGVAG